MDAGEVSSQSLCKGHIPENHQLGVAVGWVEESKIIEFLLN